ncbi:uncharacterized protein A1O9_07254 [Exophiala aquamarina CBS 119918]|uniref:Rhodopsin domain-containing protein n=1 Tax=Exophiala aquamarina CBS 119918 TaxID=1182545 RepID=A0A072PAB8_9EURO|nr:uncharacterized protein A1O9_07254 [Exophiala aquamarina CBS 119918]KEF57064.1 hypothetical protein A1O9_07254 [Exophiala aquamarina CBS 119918]
MPLFSNYPGLDDISSQLSIPALVFSITTPLIVLARFVARLTNQNHAGPDDWTVLASLMFAETVSVQMILCCAWGFGKHTKALPVELVKRTLEMYYFAQIFYKVTIGLTKISILLLYVQVFGVWKSFKCLCYLMMGLVFAFTIASVTASVFQCSPVNFAFGKTAIGGHGTCIDMTKFWYANAGFNISSDVMIILLPIIPVRSLPLPLKSKVALCGVFAIGGFVCVTSILRFTTLNVSTSHKDIMWQSIGSSMWTVIEYNLGITAACLPALRRPLARLFPALLGRTSHSWDSNPTVERNNTNNSFSTDSSARRFQRSSVHAVGHPDHLNDKMSQISRDERYRSGMRTETYDFTTDGRRSSDRSHEDILRGFPLWENGIMKTIENDIHIERDSVIISSDAGDGDEAKTAVSRFVFDPVAWRPLPKKSQDRPDPPHFR